MACQTLFVRACLFQTLLSCAIGVSGPALGLGSFRSCRARARTTQHCRKAKKKKELEKKLHKPQHDFLHERRASFFASGVTFCARFLYFIV